MCLKPGNTEVRNPKNSKQPEQPHWFESCANINPGSKNHGLHIWPRCLKVKEITSFIPALFGQKKTITIRTSEPRLCLFFSYGLFLKLSNWDNRKACEKSCDQVDAWKLVSWPLNLCDIVWYCIIYIEFLYVFSTSTFFNVFHGFHENHFWWQSWRPKARNIEPSAGQAKDAKLRGTRRADLMKSVVSIGFP